MASALDQSLDDIIKSNKDRKGGGVSAYGGGGGRTGGRGRGRGRGVGGTGPVRTIRKNTVRGGRQAPYTLSKPVIMAQGSTWQQALQQQALLQQQQALLQQQAIISTAAPAVAMPSAAPAHGIETGTRVFVSNLDEGVIEGDIKELFSEVGDVKRVSMHSDSQTLEKSAVVTFARRTDANAAIKRYNSILLDGKPMSIEIVGTNLASPITSTPVAPVPQVAQMPLIFPQALYQLPVRVKAAGFSQGRGRGIARGGRSQTAVRGGGRGGRTGRGGRGGRTSDPSKSVEQLDKELDRYHAEAMQS